MIEPDAFEYLPKRPVANRRSRWRNSAKSDLRAVRATLGWALIPWTMNLSRTVVREVDGERRFVHEYMPLSAYPEHNSRQWSHLVVLLDRMIETLTRLRGEAIEHFRTLEREAEQDRQRHA